MYGQLKTIHSLLFPTDPVLVPVTPPRGYIDPDIDRQLSTLARHPAAQEPAIRNALFTAYQPRLARICSRVWHRTFRMTSCEWEDLRQEIFPVFADLLEQWSGFGSFSAYLHGAFPWRLRAAGLQLSPRRTEPLSRAFGLLEDDTYGATEALELLEEIAATLNPFNRRLLLLKVRDGMSINRIAREMGVSHRTARRAWSRLQLSLRSEVFDDARP